MPVRFMSRKVAENICETIGEVTWSIGANTEDGGSFIWVMMIVDITQPLCWGRLITLENGEKSWIVFKYECLPNICYWCGCLDHDDKDCDIWIDSKGSLPLSQPQFGLVYVLPLNKPFSNNVIHVPGYYEIRISHRREEKTRTVAALSTT